MPDGFRYRTAILQFGLLRLPHRWHRCTLDERLRRRADAYSAGSRTFVNDVHRQQPVGLVLYAATVSSGYTPQHLRVHSTLCSPALSRGWLLDYRLPAHGRTDYPRHHTRRAARIMRDLLTWLTVVTQRHAAVVPDRLRVPIS